LENVLKGIGKEPTWFAQVDEKNTTIWARFRGVNPNEQMVEINVRRTVFYPDKPGRNYITVRGFTMRHAATPWAPNGTNVSTRNPFALHLFRNFYRKCL
jgi:hypothetical protein